MAESKSMIRVLAQCKSNHPPIYNGNNQNVIYLEFFYFFVVHFPCVWNILIKFIACIEYVEFVEFVVYKFCILVEF